MHKIGKFGRTATAVAAASLFCTVEFPARFAQAIELPEALAATYLGHPGLEAARASLRATDETVPLALSGWRPTLTGEITAGHAWFHDDRKLTPEEDPLAVDWNQQYWPRTFSLFLSQPVFNGFGTVALTSAAKNDVQAGRAFLQTVEQQVLLECVEAYSAVLRAERGIALFKEYESQLQEFERNMPADIANGVALESDRSVVATRLFTAASDRLAVEGELAQAQAFFRRTVGQEPIDLAPMTSAPRLPASLDELMALAGSAPNVVAAQYYERAANDYVDSAFSEMLPSISIEGSISRYEELYDDRQASTEGRLLGVVRVPLYEAGATSARVREAKQRVYENRHRVADERRIAEREASDAWSALRTAEARIGFIERSIDSARTALADSKRDYEQRNASGIDLADREVEILYAQLQLIDAQTDRVRAQYRILAAAGNLTARDLALDAPLYDPKQHYDDVHYKIWGTGPSLD